MSIKIFLFGIRSNNASYVGYNYPKNTGHLEWNALGDFSEFKTNGNSKEAL